MACKPELSFLVRVNKAPPDAYDGVYLYTTPSTTTAGGASKPVNAITFSGSAQLCFREDPASTVKGLHLDIAQCPMCQLPPVWDGQAMTVNATAPSPGSSGGGLFLKAQEIAGGTWHSALTNPPGIDGGRPIIRNTFGHGLMFVAIAIVAIAVIYVFARWWKSTHPVGS
ncbi:MAG TPA: hypothetical protein VI258_11420 [Rhodanobacteraceae bacterium]